MTRGTGTVFGILLMSAALAPSYAAAMVETVVVTAEPALTPRAIAFFRAVDGRLTPRGKAFSRRESQALDDGTLRPADLAGDAVRNCKTAFTVCRPGDAKALEFHVLVKTFTDPHVIARLGLNTAVFKKAFEGAGPYMRQGGLAGYRAALLSRLPPVERAKMAGYFKRTAQIRDAIQAMLMPLGYPDGGLYKISN